MSRVPRSTSRAFALVAVCAMALAACSSSSKKSTTATTASGGTATTKAPVNRGNVDGVLKFGLLEPQTGDLAAVGPPIFKGAELAIKQINDAGGVLGKPVQSVEGDDGGTSNNDIASATADRMLTSDKVDAIMGTAGSSGVEAVIDKITGADAVECSSSATAAALSTTPDNGGYFFRTAPPDKLQGPALADVITGDGHSKVAVIVRNDPYGTGFATYLVPALKNSGASVVANVAYDPKGTAFDADVKKLVDAHPDAVALISFPDTGGLIIKTMIQQGIGPDKMPIYVADGMQSSTLYQKVDPNNPASTKGIKGTAPSAAPQNGAPGFAAAYKAFAPGADTIFSAHSYDCINLIALAAESAKTDDPSVFKSKINGLSHGSNPCSTFADCKALVDQGKSIHYMGASGPLNFQTKPGGGGEPGQGTYDVYTFGADGKYTTAPKQVVVGG
jgi:branched-chain amino acid transport system substrate-binding protein